MPNFFSIKDGWGLDEQLGSMLRELDGRQESNKAAEFRIQLKALMQDYDMSHKTIVEWQRLGILNDARESGCRLSPVLRSPPSESTFGD